MKNCNLFRLSLSALLFSFTISAFAWTHSIELGYGFSHDPNNTKYNNSGFLLSGDIWSFRHTQWTNWSITGSLGKWHSSAPVNQNLTTGAVSLALRYYPWTNLNCYPGYLLVSFGPAALSNRQFGLNTQAKNITIQSNLGIGEEFNHFDVNLRLEHFSNASLAKPNEGFNIMYLLSIGYLF